MFTGLTIDYENDILVLCDYKVFTLYTINFDGSGFTPIYENPDISLRTYKGIYDFIYNTYFFAYKRENNSTIISKYNFKSNNLSEAMRISNSKSNMPNKVSIFRIIHKSCQPYTIDRCAKANCSHICLPINHTNYRCVCGENKEICTEYVSII